MFYLACYGVGHLVFGNRAHYLKSELQKQRAMGLKLDCPIHQPSGEERPVSVFKHIVELC
jgi:hypothetical protein